jgi:predicted RNA-binding Zn-ribbon protein involved in translation (DUF1610 family)
MAANSKPNTQIKTVTKKKKIDALNRQLTKIQKDFADTNLEVEQEKITTLDCMNCGEHIELPDKDIKHLMTKGQSSVQYICPHCQMINLIEVYFEEEPTIGTAVISQESVDFAYMSRNVGLLDNEQLILRLKAELKDIESGKNRKRPPEIQLIMRLMDMVLSKT